MKSFFTKDLPEGFDRFVAKPFLNNWKSITTVVVAATAVALCLVYPPMILSLAVFALASSPAMAAFGSGAVMAATALVASAVALTVASVFGLAFGAKKLFDTFFKKGSDEQPDEEFSDSEDSTVSPSLSNLGGRKKSANDETLDAEEGQHASPLDSHKKSPEVKPETTHVASPSASS
ncbi:hypothetical protein [Legionella impletisoli]|nr:hypothetical protein [Legionella impletisoli]